MVFCSLLFHRQRTDGEGEQHWGDRIHPTWSDPISRCSTSGLHTSLNFLPHHPPWKFPHHPHHQVRPWPHGPPLLLPGQPGLPGCILLLHCGSQDAGGLPLWEEDGLLQRLHHSALFLALPWGRGDVPSCRDGLWPLHRHLPSFTLFYCHEP